MLKVKPSDIQGDYNLTIDANKIAGKPCPICEKEKREFATAVIKDIAARPDTTIISITNSIFNIIEWEKHFTVKERQTLNDKVDEIIFGIFKNERVRIAKGIRSMIAWNQQNRAYTGKKEPYTSCIEQLDKVIELINNK